MAYTYDYPRMMVTVDAVVILKTNNSPLKVLLVKRGNNPYKGGFALPGGFPEMDELLADAAKRELEEETGLTGIELRQLATFDAPARDPRGRNIAVVHYGFTTDTNCTLTAGDDAAEANWFPINKLPPLAFDHKEVIEYALNYLNL